MTEGRRRHAAGASGGPERGRTDADDTAPSSSTGPDEVKAGNEDGDVTFAEARQKFSEQFWDEIEKNPGGVPFLRRMNDDLATMNDKDDLQRTLGEATNDAPTTETPDLIVGGHGSAGAAADDGTAETPSPTAEDDEGGGGSGGGGEEEGKQKDEEQKKVGFWQRCTLGGLALGVWMATWGLSSVHWPTVWWVAQRPHALAWSQELGWTVMREVFLRLGASVLRLMSAWFAVRSTWWATFACGFASAVVPVAEGL